VPEPTIRRATAEDVPAIVAMLADDVLGAARETPHDLAPYVAAFAVIDADPHQRLVVAERDGQPVGTLQLTILPGLSRRAATRALVEAVRVSRDERGSGLGARLLTWAIDEARRSGCVLVQLTTDKARTDAHRFYEKLGFEATHLGYKLALRELGVPGAGGGVDGHGGDVPDGGGGVVAGNAGDHADLDGQRPRAAGRDGGIAEEGGDVVGDRRVGDGAAPKGAGQGW
jgi:GNAT superfamily N-acetyltransferase